jgi:hypothetical protein
MIMTPHVNTLAPLTAEQIEKFWNKVDKSGNCWIWTGPVNNCGFGVARINGKNYNAHRVALFLSKQIDSRLGHASQTCGNRRCVNSDHLSEVSLTHFSMGNTHKHDATLAKREPLAIGDYDGEKCIFIPLPRGVVAFTNADILPLIEQGNISDDVGLCDKK